MFFWSHPRCFAPLGKFNITKIFLLRRPVFPDICFLWLCFNEQPSYHYIRFNVCFPCFHERIWSISLAKFLPTFFSLRSLRLPLCKFFLVVLWKNNSHLKSSAFTRSSIFFSLVLISYANILYSRPTLHIHLTILTSFLSSLITSLTGQLV